MTLEEAIEVVKTEIRKAGLDPDNSSPNSIKQAAEELIKALPKEANHE